MKGTGSRWVLSVALAVSLLMPAGMGAQQPPPPGKAGGVFPATEPDDTAGFVPIFDGKTLTGWDGDTTFWRVENGEIQFPVEEVTIAGNLVAMFQGIVAVGRDVLVRGSKQAGSILVERMTIAGD